MEQKHTYISLSERQFYTTHKRSNTSNPLTSEGMEPKHTCISLSECQFLYYSQAKQYLYFKAHSSLNVKACMPTTLAMITVR